MLRLGSPQACSREMDLDDIFLSRLKLLIIMGKAYLDGFPLGEHRRKAMLENAQHVESESIDLGGLLSPIPNLHRQVADTDFDHVFYQRVKLLAVMIKAIANGYPMGEHRRSALKENIEMVGKNLNGLLLTEFTFLKVA
jgi:hypothetical protein